MRKGLRSLEGSSCVELVRGRGLLNAIVIDDKGKGSEDGLAWDLCVNMSKEGLLAKPTHGNIIRFAPPLTITEGEMDECLGRIEKCVKAL